MWNDKPNNQQTGHREVTLQKNIYSSIHQKTWYRYDFWHLKFSDYLIGSPPLHSLQNVQEAIVPDITLDWKWTCLLPCLTSHVMLNIKHGARQNKLYVYKIYTTSILLEVLLPSPMSPYVGWLVGHIICLSLFLKWAGSYTSMLLSEHLFTQFSVYKTWNKMLLLYSFSKFVLDMNRISIWIKLLMNIFLEHQ